MSYTFLAEQAVESSAECFADIPRSALSRSSHIAERFCSSGSVTESSRGFRFGIMCAHSTENHGKESPKLYVADSHVRTSVLAEQEKVLTEKEVDCGPKCSESLARFDRHSYSWKTAQLYLFGGLAEFSGIWPRWGSIVNMELYQRQALEPHTFENESGFWPTPCKTNALAGFSPLSMERKERGETRPSGAKIGTDLKWDRRTIPFLYRNKTINPILPEWLMGWIIGWTELLPLEMDKYRQWLKRHGTSCAKEPPQDTAETGSTAYNSQSPKRGE
jgi:hypothetical protein